MNSLVKTILGKKSQKKSSKTTDASSSGVKSSRRDSAMRSSANSQSGVRRSRSGSHNQKQAGMHPSDMIAMLERRASTSGDAEAANHLFAMVAQGDLSGDFDLDETETECGL